MPAEIYKTIHDKLKNRKTAALLAVIIILVVALIALKCCSDGRTADPIHGPNPFSSSQTIAVVNEDLGVEYSGGSINYSEEFVKTLDADMFKLVSSATAEEGLKDGTYAGVIVFPASLSTSILNINYKNPQPIEIEYSVSRKINKKDSDITYDRIIEVYQTFNNKLSYAYINALMEEIELGQYNVKKIFSNDGDNLAAAEKLAEGNYNVDFDAPEMPESRPEFEAQNTDDYQTSGDKYAEDVDKLYRDAYTAAHDKASSDINTGVDFGLVEECAKAMETNVWGKALKYADETKSFSDKYVEYTGKVSDYIKTVGAYHSAVDAYLNIKKPSEQQRENMRNAWKKVSTAPGTAPGFPSTVPPPDPDEVYAAVGEFKTAVTDCQMRLELMAEKLKPNEMINTALNDPMGTSETYKDKVDERKNSFKQEARDTSSRFNEIQGENLSKLDEAYAQNSTFLGETVKVLNETNAKDHETLAESVKTFFKRAETNSKDTKSRLSAFEGMLSNAKVEGRVSSDVMEFLIQPIQLVEKDTLN